MSLVPLAEAKAHVAARCARLPLVSLPAAEALGLVLAAPVVAGEDVPPFANTAMDGFAVQAADTADAPVTLTVVDTLTAGRAPTRTVGPGEAVRIMTGAPIPEGADAVVMVERTHPGEGDDGSRVVIEVPAAVGDNIRGIGDDVRVGTEVLAAGTRLGPAQLGVLAMLGVEVVEVVRRVRVGVLSTGDELVAAGVALAPGQIRDSNRAALLAAVAAAGVEPVDLGWCPDQDEAIEETVRRGCATCDAVLSSGGVSMGDVDLVKVVLDRIGEMRWMQLAIKPAKPFAFGVVEGVPVFGLPGNPVSSLVSFELLARPALRAMMGHPHPERWQLRAVADQGLARRADGKTHFVRVLVDHDPEGTLHVRSSGGQGSHQLGAMARAQGLAVLPDGEAVAPGAEVRVMLLDAE